MSIIPNFPQFVEQTDFTKYFIEKISSCYCEPFHELKTNEYKLSKILATRLTGEVWTLYQFKKGENDFKYIIYLYIYSSQFNGSDNKRIFGYYDGKIEDVFNNKDDFKHYRNLLSDKSYQKDKYRIKINELNKLSLKELKDTCKDLNLKRSGSKEELQFRIFYDLFKLNELINM